MIWFRRKQKNEVLNVVTVEVRDTLGGVQFHKAERSVVTESGMLKLMVLDKLQAAYAPGCWAHFKVKEKFNA